MNSTALAGSAAAEKEFQEKIKERLRTAMGDLMPDAVLASIVERGIEEAFFEKQMKPNPNGWSSQQLEYPSWMVEFLEKQCREMVETAVEKWFVENQGKVEELMRETLERGLASAVVRGFDRMWGEALTDLEGRVADSFRKLRES